MEAFLRVDRSGAVVAVDDGGRRLLGVVAGRPCWDAVSARCGAGAACTPGCVAALISGKAAERRAVVVRDRPAALRCVAVGEQVVVWLDVPDPPTDPLTAREREVLVLVARGASTTAIARRLGVTASTVRTHVERARDKLGARTRAEAVARALARGELAGGG